MMSDKVTAESLAERVAREFLELADEDNPLANEDELARRIQAAINEARLDEAKWWESNHGVRDHAASHLSWGSLPNFACKSCERIAELERAAARRKKATKTTVEGSRKSV